MKHKYIILILLIVLVSGCTVKKVEETDAYKFEKEYEVINGQINKNNNKEYLTVDIPSNNIITYANYDKLNEILDGTGVIYLGYPECPWCRNAITVLLDAVYETGIDTVYYMNYKDERDIKKVENGTVVTTKEGTEGYYNLLKKLDSVLDPYIVKDADGKEHDTLEKRFLVPFVIFVRDGEIISTHTATVTSQTDPYVPLTKEQYEELFAIYTEGMHKVLNDMCDEGC